MTRYHFTVNNVSKTRMPIRPLLRQLNAACAAVFGSAKPALNVTVALIGEEAMKALKNRFYGKNKTTDALTFPCKDEAYRGEIVICMPHIQKQAKQQKEPGWVVLSHALAHAILHIEGYHHEKSVQREEQCAALEEKILARLGMEHTKNRNVKIKM